MPLLQDIAQVYNGLPTSRNIENGNTILLGLRNLVHNNKLTFETPLMTNLTPQAERFLVQQGDILFVTRGSLNVIGNVYKYNLPMQVVAGNNIAIIRANDVVDQELIYTVLNQHYYYFKHLVNNGVIMRGINLRQLKEFEW